MLKVSDLGPRLLTRCPRLHLFHLPAADREEKLSQLYLPSWLFARFPILERCLVHGRAQPSHRTNHRMKLLKRHCIHPSLWLERKCNLCFSKKTFMECQLCAWHDASSSLLWPSSAGGA